MSGQLGQLLSAVSKLALLGVAAVAIFNPVFADLCLVKSLHNTIFGGTVLFLLGLECLGNCWLSTLLGNKGRSCHTEWGWERVGNKGFGGNMVAVESSGYSVHDSNQVDSVCFNYK